MKSICCALQQTRGCVRLQLSTVPVHTFESPKITTKLRRKRRVEERLWSHHTEEPKCWSVSVLLLQLFPSWWLLTCFAEVFCTIEPILMSASYMGSKLRDHYNWQHVNPTQCSKSLLLVDETLFYSSSLHTSFVVIICSVTGLLHFLLCMYHFSSVGMACNTTHQIRTEELVQILINFVNASFHLHSHDLLAVRFFH